MTSDTNETTQTDADQGARGDGRPKQVTEDELKSMSPEEINQAYNEGRCDQLLGRV